MQKISELQHRDVININDGKKLGYIRDIELDVAKGSIEALVLPGEARFYGLFGKNDEQVIGWDKIYKLGADVILVQPDKKAPPPPAHGAQPRQTDIPSLKQKYSYHPFDDDFIDF
ncbi:MAG: YlmC/YmxH family sporulation protein [Bacillota bacterium]|nr:YlmC/YmxH family sporulation protein [Bacillota bacterium]